MIKKLPFKIIDLTHTLSPENPTWDGSCGFEKEIKLDFDECATETKFRVQKIKMHAGIGTHIDAPSHCFSDGKSVADLDLNDLISPCVVIDVSSKAGEGYSVSVDDLKEFEKLHGLLPEGSFVILHTGWDRFWHNAERYRCNYRYPSISEELAMQLLARNVVGIGIDTLSPDRPEDDFPVHRIMLGAGKYIVENVAHANLLPPTSAFALVMPMKIGDGTEAPIRLVGLIPLLESVVA